MIALFLLLFCLMKIPISNAQQSIQPGYDLSESYRSPFGEDFIQKKESNKPFIFNSKEIKTLVRLNGIIQGSNNTNIAILNETTLHVGQQLQIKYGGTFHNAKLLSIDNKNLKATIQIEQYNYDITIEKMPHE